ncbi:hypothetical protein ABVK25_000633 [Lepraria finkii]|uniref:Uncharacterized protein n=1 Tax=Lepraria finkii TaxID=1340010 RepID=A0ABR4BQS3_9LECA
MFSSPKWLLNSQITATPGATVDAGISHRTVDFRDLLQQGASLHLTTILPKPGEPTECASHHPVLSGSSTPFSNAIPSSSTRRSLFWRLAKRRMARSDWPRGIALDAE